MNPVQAMSTLLMVAEAAKRERGAELTKDIVPQTPKPPKFNAPRNALCPCGSQKKFKKCCFLTYNIPKLTDETES